MYEQRQHTRGWTVTLAVAIVVCLASCGDMRPSDPNDVVPDPPGDAGSADGGDSGPADVGAAPGVSVRFDLAGDYRGIERFFAAPFPSDLRLAAGGTQDWAGMPHPNRVVLVDGILSQAAERQGWATMPVVYFQFDGPLAEHDPGVVLAVSADADVLMANVDARSAGYGSLVPIVLDRPAPDPYVPEHLLAVAPRPGFLLAPYTRYAVVVRRSLGDANGEPLGVPMELAQVIAGVEPAAPGGPAALTLLGPAVDALEALGLPPGEIAALTVFTTGDPAAELASLSDPVAQDYEPVITDLVVADGGATWERFCALDGRVALPQFQAGTPPFTSGGVFVRTGGDHGPLVEQRVESVPIVVTVPRGEPPPGGFPVVVYLHGTGGTTRQVVDRGTITEPGGEPTPGQGPAHVLAARGFATVGTALPLNPERTPGAGDMAYITANLLAFRDNIRQGAIEQRLVFDALARLEIGPEVLAGCGSGVASGPVGLDAERVFVLGQSQGGHYANVVAALDPRVTAVVPTGAGGFQSWLVLTQQGGEIGRLLPLLLDTSPDLTFTHPAMAALQAAWEPVEPLVFMRRLHVDPLPGRAATSVFAPVGEGDSYYGTHIYDAVALSYGSPVVGPTVWSSMQHGLDLLGIVPAEYPVRANVASGTATAAIVQYEGDGLADPHTIFSQLDSVQYQYGCFFETAWRDGTPTLFAPAHIDASCE